MRTLFILFSNDIMLKQVLLGGGRGPLTPNTTSDPEYPGQLGLRTDGLNLIEVRILEMYNE